MEDKRRILIAEDDAHINELLHTALSKAGYSTVQVYSGSEAKMLLGMGENKFDLILLDLMLPGMTGEELLAKVSVLTGGADDYSTKPFEIPEVVARVQVQLRRTVNEQGSDRLTYHDLVLDRTTRQVAVSGTPLSKVTKQEYAILELLMRNPKQVFSKEDIFEYACEEPYMGETKTLDVHISNIRKKLKAVTSEEYIEIVWGIGYRLHP